jgi:hypothetical protein
MVVVLATVGFGISADAVVARRSPSVEAPDDAGRGMVYRGLRPAVDGGPCDPGHDGHYEIRSRTGRLLGCTHGPDPAPVGESLASPSAASFRSTSAEEATVPCIGDGVSGYRVQAIYAYPADMASRYGAVLGAIRGHASANVDDVMAASAAETGGGRRVRFVTDGTCQVDVDEVRLSSKGDDSFSNTISELRSRGYTRADRKYLVWMDTPPGRSSVYCGIGQLYYDETDGPSNMNNGISTVQGMFGRVDAGCWGSAGTPVEAHELMHSLGGVQRGAPNSTGRFPSPAGGHCTDEHDVMCYDDDGSGPAPVFVVCTGAAAERRYDCGHNDYFSTAPAPGSYLDTHWNAADSRFLEVTAMMTPPEPPADDGVALKLTSSRRHVRPGSRVMLRVAGSGCAQGNEVEMVSGSRLWTRRLSGKCAAVFRTRVPRTMRFRAFAYDDLGALVTRSKPITVAVRP